ncbi:MAG: sialidase family protein [Verrucomicrobiota bacterium]
MFTRYFAVWALCMAFARPALAAENRVVLNLDPDKEHPRNSEGSFVTLKSGQILFYYTQFYGGARDNSPARIVSIASDDSGRTWSQPKVVIENAGEENVMSVSLLRLKSGNIALFYLIKNSWLDCRPYIRFSTDEAQTWSEAKLVVQAPGYFVLNNDRVIQTSTGRLIMPLAFHRSRLSDPKSSRSFDARAIDVWYYSDDEGKTWSESDSWWALPAATRSGLQEPGVVELADGTLFSWARTDLGTQYGFTSKDGGKTWSAPEPTAMKSPVSPASIERLPGSADLLALYNDHSGQFPYPAGKRTPLVAAISKDGGKTWPVRKLLEDDPDGWYCYTAIEFTKDNAVLLAYCAGDSKVGRLNRLRIRRVDLEWLKN